MTELLQYSSEGGRGDGGGTALEQAATTQVQERGGHDEDERCDQHGARRTVRCVELHLPAQLQIRQRLQVRTILSAIQCRTALR